MNLTNSRNKQTIAGNTRSMAGESILSDASTRTEANKANNPIYFNASYAFQTIQNNGYKWKSTISQTMQGCVVRVSDSRGQACVIKITSKLMYKNRIGFTHGGFHRLPEDIVSETQLMHFLTTQTKNTPPTMTKFCAFFDDPIHFFLVMEDGGQELLTFVRDCHLKIKKGILSLKEWKKTVKIMFQQMAGFLDWLHCNMTCHMDISLENILISNVEWVVLRDGTWSISDKFQLKICDFGVSQKFALNTETRVLSFESTKTLGKLAYQCPGIYNKKRYDARSADIWSLGVCLLLILLGTNPWTKPDLKKEKYFNFIVFQHKIAELLVFWKYQDYMNSEIIDLLNKILVIDESERITMEQLKKHPFLV